MTTTFLFSYSYRRRLTGQLVTGGMRAETPAQVARSFKRFAKDGAVEVTCSGGRCVEKRGA